MVFSGKITNSVLSYLQAQSLENGKESELEALLETVELPLEFMRDPTSWLDAEKVENFLQSVVTFSEQQLGRADIMECVGHQAKDMKTWGVLDSVLRMIEKPPDIYLQPQRFISYFVSPAPPIANIHRGETSIAFDLPISYEEFPYVVTYLRAAMEAVPLFMGAQMADVNWEQNHIAIQWQDMQPLLQDENFNRRQMAPEVMQNLINTLEKTEQALVEKSRELDRIKIENAMAAQSQSLSREEFKMSQQNVKNIQDRVMRLQDYFIRSQQLITLLVGQDRMSPQVREAMKRVNWEHVQQSYSAVTEEIMDAFHKNKAALNPVRGENHVQNQQTISP